MFADAGSDLACCCTAISSSVWAFVTDGRSVLECDAALARLVSALGELLLGWSFSGLGRGFSFVVAVSFVSVLGGGVSVVNLLA